MKGFKFWPHVAILVLVCAAIGGVVGALLVRHEQPAEAQVIPVAARMERVDGQVALNRGLNNSVEDQQWVEVTPNTPVSSGDRLYTRDNSRASIAFTGRNFARLDDNTSLDVLALSSDRTQLALREGSAIFNVGELDEGDLFEVATPYGAIDLQEPGLYQVGIDDRGSTIVSVLSGLAQVVGLAGSGQISKGEMLTLLGQTAADIALSRLDPAQAGSVVDDYYGYQYPDYYDGRYSDYNAYLNDPFYYDPYKRYSSYQYVTDTVPGIYDLDAYGEWQDVSGYGYAWRPRVDAGWAPYQQGQWMMDDLYGMTWVSSEPWGYAPYHYGRWAYINNQWLWIPDGVNTEPAYSPALVAFVPLTEANMIGWAPLGPGDPYAVTYYDADLQPVYITSAPVIEQQLVNFYAPGAVTVVPVQDFNSPIDARKIKKIEREMLARARPVLDPFTVGELKQAALQNEKGLRKIDIPKEVARRLNERPVFASSAPPAPPFMKDRDLGRKLRVESVPEQQRKEKLEFKDNRQQTASEKSNQAKESAGDDAKGQAAAADQQRKQKIEELSTEAARGNKEARRQVRELEREQRRQERSQQTAARRQQDAERKAAPAQAESARGAQRAQGARVAQPAREQKETSRQRERGRAQQAQSKPATQQAPQKQQRAAEKPQKQQGSGGGGGGGSQKPQKGGGKGKGLR